MERRRDLRFEIRLKGHVQLAGMGVVDASTINLSRSVALILISPVDGAASMPQSGEALRAEFLLPANRMFEQRCLSCKAVAVRTWEDGQKWVVALQFQQIEFRPVTDRAPINAMAAISGGSPVA
jgi:hypothetical protein